MAERDITQLVNRLVDHTLARHGVPEQARQGQSTQLFSYAIRLLGSNVPRASSTVPDEQAVLQAIRQDLEMRGSPNAARLLECHNKLVNNNTLKKNVRWALLTLLRQASRDGQVPRAGGPALSSHLGFLKQAMDTGPLLPTLQQGSTTSSRPVSAAGSMGVGAGQQPAPYRVSFPSSLESSFSSQNPSTLENSFEAAAKASGRRGVLGSAVDDSATFTVKEPLLVRDVLYACQGISGKFTHYQEATPLSSSSAHNSAMGRGAAGQDALQAEAGKGPAGAAGGGFVVVPEADVPEVERALMARLTELGWLFRKVKAHAAEGAVSTSADSSSSQEGGASVAGGGAVRQALAGALSSELADFYRLMAVLEAHTSHPIPLPGDGESGGSGPYLTLRRLAVWLAEPLRRMRLLASLADATAGLKGGALAGAVHALAQHGDPFVSSYMSKVLHSVSVPLFDMIRKWVFEGALEDPHGEFFVRSAKWVAASAAAARGELAGDLATLSLAGGPSAGPAGVGRDLWRAGYWVEASQLPPFISDALAQKVLRAGKSINFLQDVCGDGRWVQEAASAAAAAAAQAAAAGQVEALERVVSEAAAMVDRRLMEVLRGPRFNFDRHADAVQRYLLLGQGDFVQALMDLVSKELDQDAGVVSEISLNHALRTALTSTSASRVDDEDVLERLRARKDRSATGGEQGWDVFSLHYDVRGPLATLFTPTAMSQYLRVFQLLWRLKRVEASLSSAWVTLKCEVERTLGRLPSDGVRGAEAAVRRCLLLRAEMCHFATNLQYYLMFEVLEASRQEFVVRANAAADLDQLIAAHEEYLATLLRKSLLDEGSQALRATLNELTTNMLQLAACVKNLNQAVQVADRYERDRKRRVKERTDRGEWGVQGEEAAAVRGVPAEDLAPILRRLEELGRTHARALQTFTNQLPAQTHDEVRFLLYRLDFNEFRRRTLDEGLMGDDDMMVE